MLHSWRAGRRRHRGPRRGGGRAGPRPGAAAGRARGTGVGRRARAARGPGAPEGQLPPPGARGARPRGRRGGAPSRRPDGAPAGGHGGLLRHLAGRPRRGGRRPGADGRPAVRPLPDRARRPRRARGRPARPARRGGHALARRGAAAAPGDARRLRRGARGARDRARVPAPRRARRSVPAARRRPSDPRGGPQMTTRDEQGLNLQIEVPGTPEQVWEAIATGPGITAWFMPAETEGGTITFHHAPGQSSEAQITDAEAPNRLRFVEGPGGAMATEFLVEARAGGTCVVRVVTSGFGDKSANDGWTAALLSLRLYLEHFAGRHASVVVAGGVVPGPAERAWEALRGALGLGDLD